MATRVSQAAEEEEQEGDILARCRGFMSPPVTDTSVLQERKMEMRTRMEMLIMETQADFCRALQEVDGGTFKVDRWHRKEGGEELGQMQDGKGVIRIMQHRWQFCTSATGRDPGIGGIFSDAPTPKSGRSVHLVKSCARTVGAPVTRPQYKHLNTFTDEEKDWAQGCRTPSSIGHRGGNPPHDVHRDHRQTWVADAVSQVSGPLCCERYGVRQPFKQ
ncbi:oxygen-dependent coproporphyrinogen-III oxidase, mitochondrial [Lates japonicus]|uniref:coproporphyrinogen oxidase n=1 Tax=Lates japonicus TaxID=270547 RepID=A0AAD3NPH7_LATJO|nr:oxygen-dependent coproporphyrinogen-III oxidase, mitochondrial [Lates japonicus]